MIHRNSILTGILILSMGIFLLFLWIIYEFGANSLLGSQVFYQWDLKFWLNYGPSGTAALSGYLVQSALLVLLGITAGYLVRRRFQRSASMGSFFMAIFFFLLGVESLKLLIPLYEIWNVSYIFSAITSRLVYGFRLLELMVLLTVALYALGFEYQKANRILFGALVISLALMFYWPLDNQGLTSSLLNRIAEEPPLVFVDLILISLTFGSLFLSGLLTKNFPRLGDSGILSLVILGRVGTYFPGMFYPGFIALALGTFLLLQNRMKDDLGL